MTALSKYARLEATALWRPSADAQRREVFISIGEATLVIADAKNNAPLTHWSLAAIERQNSGLPVIYAPVGDPGETIELSGDQTEMIEAIETLRKAVLRARPKPGRLRWLGVAATCAIVAVIALLWLPGALHTHALNVVPSVKRAEIGTALLGRITRVGGAPCTAPGADRALRSLAARTGAKNIAILPGGVSETLYLPGGTILLNRTLVEDFEDPFVAAGYVLAELARTDEHTALSLLLDTAGLSGTASLLATGKLPNRALDDYAQQALSETRPAASKESALHRFQEAAIPTTPYALALDISGETTMHLIEADPMANSTPRAVMPDADWLRLQAICES